MTPDKMTDYFTFNSANLFLSKFIVIGVIHAALAFIVIEGALWQGRRRVLLLPAGLVMRLLPGLSFRLGAGAVLGTVVAVLSSVGVAQMGPQTLLVINAAFLTLWYVECTVLLAFGFFARLLDDELPFEIRLFISFIVMVNAGYFTLMFLVSLLRAPTLF